MTKVLILVWFGTVCDDHNNRTRARHFRKSLTMSWSIHEKFNSTSSILGTQQEITFVAFSLRICSFYTNMRVWADCLRSGTHVSFVCCLLYVATLFKETSLQNKRDRIAKSASESSLYGCRGLILMSSIRKGHKNRRGTVHQLRTTNSYYWFSIEKSNGCFRI